MIDRVQVPPRARGDVHEPHGSPWVHGASHHVADDTHGLEIQLAQRSIPCRHLGEVVAQPHRATARFPVVRPRGNLDSQFRSASRGHQFSVERRTPRRGRFRGLDDNAPLKLCRYSGNLSNATVMEPPTHPGARRRGKEKRLSLGVYPDVSLRDARDRRDEARKLLVNGIDPNENRKAAKAAKVERRGFARSLPTTIS